MDRAESSNERFVQQRKLGRGAMGAVYEVLDRERNALVALKTLRLRDAVAIYRFKREFRTLTDLSHPNLCKLYELLSDGDSWFFTMERIEGTSFMQYVRPKPPQADDDTTDFEPGTSPTRILGSAALDEARLRSCLAQLALGLDYLHRAGKLHRDVKPSNVLVTDDGRVVICDFGLVVESTPAEHNQTADHRLAGTPAYMAPEQTGANLSDSCDWYSVGIMIYEALTGQLPFGGTPHDVLATKRRSRPPAPSELADGLPPDLEALCMELLSPSPDERPTGSEILARLGVSNRARTAPHAEVPFVGRARELAALGDALERVCDSATVVACVHASSGLGKSALLRCFLDSVDRGGRAIVLEGRCYEQESVPYKALDAVIDALTRQLMRLPEDLVEGIMPRDILALVRLFPVLRRVEAVAMPRAPVLEPPDPQESRRRAFGALRALLYNLSQHEPLVLAIDDLQWGDADSAALLEEVLRQPDPPRMLVLAAYRSEDATATPFLAAFLPRHQDARFLPLQPLSAEEAHELTRRLVAGRPDADRAVQHAIAAEAGGNPFLLTELSWYASTSRAIDEPLAYARISVDEMLDRRVRALPTPARNLLVAVAVAGRPIRQVVAKHAAQTGGEAEAAMAHLRSNRLLRGRGAREGDLVECYHDRIRETATRSLGPDALRGWHRRLAVALEGYEDSDLDALAMHFHGAGELERAAHYAVLAAKQAAGALAFDRAVSLYRFAIELRSDEANRSPDLWEQLGGALEHAARGHEAARAYLEAAKRSRLADNIDLMRRAAEQLLRSGHVDEGLEVIGVVLDSIGMRLPSTPRRAMISLVWGRLRTRLRGTRYKQRDRSQITPESLRKIDACWSVAAGLGMVDTIRGMVFQSRHYAIALDSGDLLRVSRAFALELMYGSTAGMRARRRTTRLAALGREVSAQSGEPEAIGFASGAEAMCAYQLGEFATARERADQALDLFNNQCVGLAWEKSSAELIAMWSLYNLGELRELQRRVASALRRARTRGDRFFETSVSIGIPAAVWLATDEPDEGRRTCTATMRHWEHLGFLIQHYWEWLALRQIELYEGAPTNALRRVRETWKALEKAFFLGISAIDIEAHDLRARAAIAAACAVNNDRAPLLRAAERDARRLRRGATAWSRALGGLLLANIQACRAGGERAISALASAEDELRAIGMAMHADAAQRRRGELIGGDQGAELVRGADERLTAQNIVAPARMAHLLVPGGD